MLIQCTIERKNGTQVKMGAGSSARNYHFTEDGEGMHVCDVTNKDDIARFLSISESYCLPGASADDDGDEPDKEKATDEELANHATSIFGIEDADDKCELYEFANEMLNLNLKKTMKPSTMIRKMIESANEQDLYQ